MTRPKRSRPMRDISPTHPNAAAIDIGAKMHVAAAPPDRDVDPVRTFGTFTGDLHRMADWFGELRRSHGRNGVDRRLLDSSVRGSRSARLRSGAGQRP
jgi:hypothetical protein